MASTKKQPPSDRWQYGVPPVGNANFAWVQHFLYHLAPRGKGVSAATSARNLRRTTASPSQRRWRS